MQATQTYPRGEIEKLEMEDGNGEVEYEPETEESEEEGEEEDKGRKGEEDGAKKP